MGKKSTYCNLHKSKRNKRPKAAKLRWSKKIDNSVNHNSPHLFGIFDEERHKFDQWNNQREGESANFNLSDSFANQCLQSMEPKELDTLNDRSPELTVNPNLCLKKYIPHHFIKDKEYGTISSDECERISNYPLTTEKCSKSSVISGNRIVELGYVIDQVLQLQYEHCQICTPGKLYIRNEIRKGKGFISTILLQCNQCTKTFEIETENPKTPMSVMNTGAVWGTVATGSTYSHMEEKFSCMDIPVISKSMFYSLEEKISVELKSAMWRSIEAAGIKEKQFAISQQQFSTDKTPLITVYVDGSWSKRSYGTNYNSLSGMVGIIGRHTGEILYIGIWNRFCSICARAEHKKQQPKVHICYKNWIESAQAMEADMVVEGFNFSQEMHGVKYGKFIGDGDSSVFANIKQKVTYDHEVQKIECTNHVLKNYGKHLRAIKKDMQINSEGKKLLTINVIEKLTKRAKSSIYEHPKADKNVSLLREKNIRM